MAKKISELIEATSIEDADLIPIVQSGVNKKITKANFGGGLGYLVYNAKLTQSGSATVSDGNSGNGLQNTLGAPVVWSRTEDPYYIGTTNIPDSDLSKCILAGSGGAFLATTITITDYSDITGEIILTLGSSGGFVAIFIEVLDYTTFEYVDFSTVCGGGVIFNLPELKYFNS